MIAYKSNRNYYYAYVFKLTLKFNNFFITDNGIYQHPNNLYNVMNFLITQVYFTIE